MNYIACMKDKYFSFLVGAVLLAASMVLTVASFAVLPFIGLFLTLPFLAISFRLLAEPVEKSCRL